MGWTGPGLTRDRAHLHFEIAFQINGKFAEWVDVAKPGRLWQPNRHGQWNGLNLMGIDPIPLLKAANQGTPLTCEEALSKQPCGFTVRVPPFMGTPTWMQWVESKSPSAMPVSWDIEMTPWGLPLKMEAGSEVVVEPVLIANPGKPSEGKYYCRGLVQADGKGGMKLSKFGRQTMEMMLYTGPTPSP